MFECPVISQDGLSLVAILGRGGGNQSLREDSGV